MSEIPPPTVPPSMPPPGGGGSYTPPPPPRGTGAGPGNTDRTIMLVLSYAWFFSLIPFIIKKDDREVQWHAKNGLVMAIAYTAIEIGFWLIGHYVPLLGCLIFFVPCLVFIGYVILQILAIMKAVNGQRFRVPMLSDYAEKM